MSEMTTAGDLLQQANLAAYELAKRPTTQRHALTESALVLTKGEVVASLPALMASIDYVARTHRQYGSGSALWASQYLSHRASAVLEAAQKKQSEKFPDAVPAPQIQRFIQYSSAASDVIRSAITDLDSFKDTHGAQAADTALSRYAEALDPLLQGCQRVLAGPTRPAVTEVKNTLEQLMHVVSSARETTLDLDDHRVLELGMPDRDQDNLHSAFRNWIGHASDALGVNTDHLLGLSSGSTRITNQGRGSTGPVDPRLALGSAESMRLICTVGAALSQYTGLVSLEGARHRLVPQQIAERIAGSQARAVTAWQVAARSWKTGLELPGRAPHRALRGNESFLAATQKLLGQLREHARPEHWRVVVEAFATDRGYRHTAALLRETSGTLSRLANVYSTQTERLTRRGALLAQEAPLQTHNFPGRVFGRQRWEPIGQHDPRALDMVGKAQALADSAAEASLTTQTLPSRAPQLHRRTTPTTTQSSTLATGAPRPWLQSRPTVEPDRGRH